MKPCWDTSPHRCHLGRHLPDLTRDPDEQSPVARLLGGLLLVALFVLAAAVPGQ